MSLGRGTDTLRAVAHPVRLRILSLLTGAPMSAAELARELGLTHANASYHLRQLAAAGLVELAEERSNRGGRERRYRHDPAAAAPLEGGEEGRALWWRALADELARRSTMARTGGDALAGASSDAELWVEPDTWERAVRQIQEAIGDLHRHARPPQEPGTERVSVTVALFALEPKGPGQPA